SFFSVSTHYPYLHSFPTRRSSDLIKINTKNPFDSEGAAVEFGVGSFGRTDFRAYLGEQLSDTAAFSIAGAWLKNDGYVEDPVTRDRKSTRLNSSHVKISYAVFCLK